LTLLLRRSDGGEADVSNAPAVTKGRTYMKCKVTLPNGRSKANATIVWEEGVTHYAKKGEVVPCTDTAIHFYEHPLLAVFFAPLHTYDCEFILWEYVPVGKIKTDGCKSWSEGGTTIRQIEIPILTTEQRVSIAIQAALLVCKNPLFVVWAKGWLDGSDRSEWSADKAAARAANIACAARAASAASAASAAELAAARAECYAARSAVMAARAAASAAARAAVTAARSANIACVARAERAAERAETIKTAFKNAGFNLD